MYLDDSFFYFFPALCLFLLKIIEVHPLKHNRNSEIFYRNKKAAEISGLELPCARAKLPAARKAAKQGKHKQPQAIYACRFKSASPTK
jgi:hypothetical protein